MTGITVQCDEKPGSSQGDGTRDSPQGLDQLERAGSKEISGYGSLACFRKMSPS
ncbi:MAG: hypothetical protein ACLPOO_15960 [Terriglobales bacterium]